MKSENRCTNIAPFAYTCSLFNGKCLFLIQWKMEDAHPLLAVEERGHALWRIEAGFRNSNPQDVIPTVERNGS